MYNRIILIVLCAFFFIGSSAIATEESNEITDDLDSSASCYSSCCTYDYYVKRDSGAWAMNDFLFSYAINQLEETDYHEIAEKIIKAVHNPNAELSLINIIPMMVYLPKIITLANQLHIPYHELLITFDAIVHLSADKEYFDILFTSKPYQIHTVEAMLILLRAVAYQQEYHSSLLKSLNGNALTILLSILNHISKLDIQQAKRVIYTLFENNTDDMNSEEIWAIVHYILPTIPELLNTMNTFVLNRRRNALYQDILQLLEELHLIHLENWNTVLQEEFLEGVISTHLETLRVEYKEVIDSLLSLRGENHDRIHTMLKNAKHPVDQSRIKYILLSSYIVSAVVLDAYLVPDTHTRYDRYMNTFYNMREITLELLEIHDIIKDYIPAIHQWWIEKLNTSHM